MLQIILTLAIFVILVIPMGKYMYHIATKQKTFADKVFNPIDRCIYKVCGIKGEDMGWKKYALTLLLVNAVMVFVGYAILRLQSILFLNPNGISNMEPTLSFNTIISFMTNTNLQHYSGESGLSYVAQMCVIIFMMFTSAATGYAACMAFCRGLAGKKIGNFYEDMVRITTRILIPASFIVGLLLVSQGTPQTLQGNFTIETLEGNFQDIAVGPVAALESIKHLGTNGGGFFGANSTTPFENPTVISNIIEMISMMLLPGACVVTFGHMLHDKRKEKKAEKVAMNAQVLPGTAQKKVIFGRQGAVVFGAMAIIFLIGLTICYQSEMAGNPVIQEMGIDQSQGSMEGKEVHLIEMRDELAVDANVRHRPLLLKEIEKYVHVHTGCRVEEVTADGVRCRDQDGNELMVGAQTVICALGQRGRTDVVEALRNGAPFVRVIGDARKVSTITNAVYQGYHAALDI